ncbi:MAG: AlpA family phage regulatory protein [Bdellovibrionota bacterium]
MSKTVEQKDHELPRLIGFREVRRLCGLSRATVWRMERAGIFPRRRQLSASKVAWMLSEILRWIEDRQPVLSESKPENSPPESKPIRKPSWLDRDDD